MMNQGTVISALFLLVLLSTACGIVAADNLAAIGKYNMAVDLAYEGKLDEALAEIDQALMASENFTLAHVTRAGILNALGRYQEAVDAADRALALDPASAPAWNNRADALIGLRRYSDALIAAERAAELDPLLTEAWVNQGSALNELGRYQEAVGASDRALALDPGSTGAQMNRETGIQGMVPVSPTAAPFPAGALLGAGGLVAILMMRRLRTYSRIPETWRKKGMQ
jgi:tetratricopeptide (TPR) repeat protein